MSLKNMNGSVRICRRNSSYFFRNAVNQFSTKSTANSRSVSNVKWEAVIGLEVHAQITTETKMFSGSSTKFGAPPNMQVSFFDAGHPGTLPVLNKRCVEAGVLTALALGCKINKKSMFDRKHYFYSDLPVGYQITQQNLPLAANGKINFITSNPSLIKEPYHTSVNIKQLQLEQDSGKSLHDIQGNYSLIDLNRAGVPLMEIVFEPDLKTGEEAASLIRELHLILTRLGTCNCKMEEGSMRVDANVSVHRTKEPMGVRTEIKNLNSVRAVARAIEYEINRQVSVLENGGTVENETMMFDSKLKVTLPMRDKEKVQDYRYMPEPNLPPLLLCDDGDDVSIQAERINIDALRRHLPELPTQSRRNLMNKYNLSLKETVQLMHNDTVLHYFKHLMDNGKSTAKTVINFIFVELMSSLSKVNLSIEECPVSLVVLNEALELRENGIISPAISQKLLDQLVGGDRRQPKQIVQENHWYKITDKIELEKVCKEVLNKNESFVRNSKNDKTKVFYTLVGRVKKATAERADMSLVMQIMKELLEKY